MAWHTGKCKAKHLLSVIYHSCNDLHVLLPEYREYETKLIAWISSTSAMFIAASSFFITLFINSGSRR